MKRLTVIVLIVVLVATGIVMLGHYRQAERYEIVYSKILSVTNTGALLHPAGVCYSNSELKEAVPAREVLTQTGMLAFNFDEPNTIGVFISNYRIENAYGRGELGFITVRKMDDGKVAFAVIKGTKRMLQFNYLDGRPER